MANSSRSFSNLSNRTFSIDLPLDGITVSHHGSASIEIDASFNGANSNGSESSTASFSSSSSRSNSTRSSSTSTTGISSAGSTRHATGNISENSDMDSVEYSVSFEDTQSSPNFSIDISQVEAEIERSMFKAS
ncbi:vitellogenin-2-like [Drosophila obscura]|uniref:vitellogenin-2-like n=1 Tax=Drosophila obscura TaxID=7282 RepID=UPI001BB19D03|nr:vitellogenin-2-like [Drosophila obscura]